MDFLTGEMLGSAVSTD